MVDSLNGDGHKNYQARKMAAKAVNRSTDDLDQGERDDDESPGELNQKRLRHPGLRVSDPRVF
jgi:hypothetical protein